MASEAGQFDFEAVAGAICEKLLRRHPHVFGERAQLSAAQQSIAWEEIKAHERGAADPSAMQGVPDALPALMRADKLSKRAARVGFDFELASQSADKVAEELAEVRDAAAHHPDRGGRQARSRDLRRGRRSVVRGGESGAQTRCRRGGGAARGQCEIRTALSPHGAPRHRARRRYSRT